MGLGIAAILTRVGSAEGGLAGLAMSSRVPGRLRLNVPAQLPDLLDDLRLPQHRPKRQPPLRDDEKPKESYRKRDRR
jgi:hypothetical protein